MLSKVARINVESLKDLEKYISSPTNPKFFFTMTEINKVGINPRSKYNTPLGVYCYPLTQEFYDMILTNKLPFVGEQPYIVLFTISVPTFNLTKYTDGDLIRDTEKLKLIYNWKKEMEPNETGAITDFDIKQAFKDARYQTPIGKFWNLTRVLSKTPFNWAHLLRKLGYTNFYDPGESVIHPNEPNQAVIIDPQIIIPIETFFNPHASGYKSLPHVPSSEQQLLAQKAVQLRKLRSKLDQIKDPKAIDQIAKNYIANGDIINALVYNKNISPQTIEYIVNNIKESDNFDKYMIQDLWSRLAISSNTPIDIAVKAIENTEYLEGIFGKKDSFGRTDGILRSDLLRELAKNKNSQIKIYVATNIFTPLDALEILANDSYDLVREAVAFNRNSSPELLDKLAEDNDRIKLAVIKNDKISTETLKKIIDNTDNSTIKSYIAANDKCTPEMLETLFADEKTHSGLATNTNISENLFNKLVDSPSSFARQTVAQKTQNENILKKLCIDPDFYVRYKVLENRNTPLEVFETMVYDKDESIRNRLAADSRLVNGKIDGEKILNILSNDTSRIVRERIASNRNAPFQALSNLSEDKEKYVRQLVAENSVTPIEILEKLSHDEYDIVRDTASRALASKLEKQKQTSASNNTMIIKQSKKEISLKVVKKLPYKTLARMISKAKNHLKTDDVWKDLCKEYDEEVDIIDLIPTKFGDLDVSATTEKGVVTLNYRLLCDGDFYKDYSYLIHEYTHWFQQCYGDKPTQSSDDGNYLENPFEQDAFTKQVNYIDDNFGKEEAEDYVDNLLDHHDVTKKKEKDKLEAVFLKDV